MGADLHTEACEVGNVSVPQTFRAHDGLREFWTNYRKTFGEMHATGRKVRRFMAYFDTRDLTSKVVDRRR